LKTVPSSRRALEQKTSRGLKCKYSRLTVGISEEGEVCSMQKGGNQGLTIEEIDTMVELVIKKAKELRSVFKK